MNFLELADQVQRTEPADMGSSNGGSEDKGQNFSTMASMADRVGADDDEQRASIMAMLAFGAGRDGDPEYGKDPEDDDDDTKASIPERVLKWFLKKLVGKVTRAGAEVIIESIWSAVRWFAEDVLVAGIRATGEFLLRSVLLESVGFLVSNPVGWAVLGAAGAATAAYYIYKYFFSGDKSPSNYQMPEAIPEFEGYHAQKEYFYSPENAPQDLVPTATPSLPATTQTPVAAAAQPSTTPRATTPTVRPAAETTTQPAPQQPAGAPRASGAPRPPVSAPAPIAQPGSGDSLENYVRPIIARHEGRKNRPYKDSKGLWTIGIGHLIGDGHTLPSSWDRTLSDNEVDALFTDDFQRHLAIAQRMPNFDKFNLQGQAALVDMAFNLGQFWTPHGNSRGWPSWTAKMQAFDVQGVVDNLQQNTVWRSQVHGRADEDIALLATNIQTSDSTTRFASRGPGPTTGGAGPTSTTNNARSIQQPLQVANSEIIRGPNGQPMRIN